MHGIVDELAALVTEGNALIAESEAGVAALQGWVTQRGIVLLSLQCREAEWLPTDRHAVRSLIEQMLAVDATLIPRLNGRLENLGKEILAARKIRDALANGTMARRSSLLIERPV